MEIKQLECFIAAVETKSLNKAAEILYTSQPNISKVIQKFEKDMGQQLLERTSKGVQITDFGEKIYEYAKSIIKTKSIMEEMAIHQQFHQLKISSYSSNMISRELCEFYNEKPLESIHLDFQSGTIEEVIENVSQSKSNIGFYIMQINRIMLFILI